MKEKNCGTCEWRDEDGFCVHKYSENSTKVVDELLACYWWQEKEDHKNEE